MESNVAKMLPRYLNHSEYQEAHDRMYSCPIIEGIETVLPPGVTQEDFAKALEELKESIGEEYVFTGSNLKEYVDPYEIPEGGHERKIASAAVQEVLKVANKFKIPLWTLSRGKNLGYGGPSPCVSGSIVLDLHRMNKIIEVNDKFSYAVVEPGVTFGDLYNYCAENNLKVWPSTASLGWGSVIGNTLDRGMGFIPTGIHHENIAGLEVVLADGDVVRTGQFAMTTSQSAHNTKLTFGPTIDGLFLQSNLGIVTKMGINLTPQPQAYMACSFDMPDIEDIEFIVDTFGEFRRNGTIPYMAYVYSVIEWTAIFGKRGDWYDGEGPIPDWRVKEIQKELDTGFWTCKFGLYGPLKIIQEQFNEIKRVTEKNPKGTLRCNVFHGSEPGKLLDATDVPQPYGGMFVGVPSMWSLPLVDYYIKPGGVGAHSAYSPIIPLEGKLVLDWVKAAKAVYESQGFDLLCDFFMGERHAVFVCMLCFDKTVPEQRAAIDKIFHGLFEEGKKRGFAKYRAHVNHMDMVSDLFDFNDHAYRRFVERLKDTLDPNGILSPGKMGVWPQRLRELRGK